MKVMNQIEDIEVSHMVLVAVKVEKLKTFYLELSHFYSGDFTSSYIIKYSDLIFVCTKLVFNE